MVGVPVAAYLFGQLLRFSSGGSYPLVLFTFVSLTAAMVLALLRLLMLVRRGIVRFGGHGRMVLMALFGLAGPLGGLVLNARIPFPVDFQSRGVYLLAILNGLALLLPVEGGRLHHRLAWLAQCAGFAFTTYFMLVFLPFLPLSLLAIMAFGSGVLMLVPLVLFVLHAQQLAAGWRAARASPEVALWVVAALAAVLALPGVVVQRARHDRAVLHAALAHVYSPDYAGGKFKGDLESLQRGLEHLRDFKAGLQLPFIGEFYNRVVYGGLVLPDTKLQNLYLTFFGRSLPPVRQDRLNAGLFGSSGRSFTGGWRSTPPPTNTVELAALDTVRAEEGDCETATAKLVLHNTGAAPAEYVTQLRVPPGVFVSGYWLHIGVERVPGRIFEKKAALWVYEMIRDLTRRDPGLMLYKTPGAVELRVFPLAAGETRTTEIELIWPRGLQPPLQIAGRAIDTRAAAPAPAVRIVNAGARGRLLVAFPPRLREQGAKAAGEAPYLHAIVDASAGADPAKLAARARDLAKRVPGVQEVVLSAANFEVETPQQLPAPLDQLDALAGALKLPVRGGFCRDRAIKSALAWNQAHAPQRRVVIGVITADAPRAVLADEDLAYYAAWHPCTAGYLEARATGEPKALDFRHEPAASVVRDATAWPLPEGVVLLPLDGEEPVALALPAGPTAGGEVTNSRYGRAAAAWLCYADWLQRPAGRDDERTRIVEESRAANALTPLSSFIVVENSAQWRTLEAKEKQKLANADALEIQKAPEPSTWLLAAGLGVWLLARRRRPGRLTSGPEEG